MALLASRAAPPWSGCTWRMRSRKWRDTSRFDGSASAANPSSSSAHARGSAIAASTPDVAPARCATNAGPIGPRQRAALRNAGLLRSHRGGGGGWSLAKPADQIAVADVIRALDGPLASVRGLRPDELVADGADPTITQMWVAVRAALRGVLEHVTVADLANGTLAPHIAAMTDDPDAWAVHRPAR